MARAMQARGHEVEVVAAHPHYPEPVWGRRLIPYREIRDGVRVLRLPLWVGRRSALQRMARSELHDGGVVVPEGKLVRSYNPASRPILDAMRDSAAVEPTAVLTMGNIGHSQNLVNVVRAFEDSHALRELGARFVLAGDGEAGPEVRAAIRTERADVTGVLTIEPLERELRRAAVSLVSQGYEGIDFNVPSKLMNFMAHGIPTVASVRADSEVARIIRASGGGWVTDSADTGQLASKLADVLKDRGAREERGRAALAFAQDHFSPEHTAERFESALHERRARREWSAVESAEEVVA